MLNYETLSRVLTNSKNPLSKTKTFNSAQRGDKTLPLKSDPNYYSNSLKLNDDFLSVQILFKELELDCDEQIKKLDSIERELKTKNDAQKKIIEQVILNTKNFGDQQKGLFFKDSNNKIRKDTQIVNSENISRIKNKKTYKRQNYFKIRKLIKLGLINYENLDQELNLHQSNRKVHFQFFMNQVKHIWTLFSCIYGKKA
jgi:hypothetical protein